MVDRAGRRAASLTKDIGGTAESAKELRKIRESPKGSDARKSLASWLQRMARGKKGTKTTKAGKKARKQYLERLGPQGQSVYKSSRLVGNRWAGAGKGMISSLSKKEKMITGATIAGTSAAAGGVAYGVQKRRKGKLSKGQIRAGRIGEKVGRSAKKVLDTIAPRKKNPRQWPGMKKRTTV
jgi:hypothetical protein